MPAASPVAADSSFASHVSPGLGLLAKLTRLRRVTPHFTLSCTLRPQPAARVPDHRAAVFCVMPQCLWQKSLDLPWPCPLSPTSLPEACLYLSGASFIHLLFIYSFIRSTNICQACPLREDGAEMN